MDARKSAADGAGRGRKAAYAVLGIGDLALERARKVRERIDLQKVAKELPQKLSEAGQELPKRLLRLRKEADKTLKELSVRGEAAASRLRKLAGMERAAPVRSERSAPRPAAKQATRKEKTPTAK